MLFFIRIIGFCLNVLPKGVINVFVAFIAAVVFYCIPSRRKIIYSNLSHCFPHKPHSWRRRIAKGTLRRMVEMGLFVLVGPYWSRQKIQKQFSLTSGAAKMFHQMQDSPGPSISLVPHFCLMEMITLVPAISSILKKPIGVIYRPFGSPAIENWVKQSREQFGMELLSRKDGLNRAQAILKEGGVVAVLFDQNAGFTGELSTFFGRLASTAHLPFLWAQKYKAQCYIAFTQRQGLWKSELDIEALDSGANCDAVTLMLKANLWLENALKDNPALSKEWLWAHRRWNTQSEAHRRLRIELKRDRLPETLAFHKWDTLPRNERFFIRMPNWLGDVVMAIPLLRAIRKGRPDAEMTLLAQAHLIPLLRVLGLADNYLALPPKSFSYYRFFWRLRRQFPDSYLCFTNSLRGDIEAFLTRTPQRFGIARPQHKRKLLTHTWLRPKDLNEAEIHQSHLWWRWLNHFGLREELATDPIPHSYTQQKRICLICGTENTPAKRWPVQHWIRLIQMLHQHYPHYTLELLGTANDRTLTNQIQAALPNIPLTNSAGQTNLLQFSEALGQASLVICNDSGGMHLANALGTPLVAVFGPTNPIRTGPIFDSPHSCILPSDAPETGGGSISEVSAQRVFEEAQRYLAPA